MGMAEHRWPWSDLSNLSPLGSSRMYLAGHSDSSAPVPDASLPAD
jgi:hypothetical protein